MSVPVEYFKDVAEASGSQVEYDELVLEFLQESEMTEGNCSFQEVREFAVERLSRAYNEKKCLKSLQALVGSGKVLKLHGVHCRFPCFAMPVTYQVGLGISSPGAKAPCQTAISDDRIPCSHAAGSIPAGYSFAIPCPWLTSVELQYNHDLYHRSCWVLSGDDKTAEISEPKMIAVEDCWSYGAQVCAGNVRVLAQKLTHMDVVPARCSFESNVGAEQLIPERNVGG